MGYFQVDVSNFELHENINSLPFQWMNANTHSNKDANTNSEMGY